MPLADILRSRRAEILSRWERAVLADPALGEAQRISTPELRDHVPTLLDGIAKGLDESRASEEATAVRDIAMSVLPRSHALQRIADGYSVRAVLHELEHLRSEVVRTAGDEGAVDRRGVLFFHLAIDECMSIAVVEMETAATMERERFVGVLGHDLRTPVSAIKMAGALLAQDPPSEQRRLFADKILRAADRMNEMIGSLVDFASARAGTIALERRLGSLRSICVEVVDELRLAHAGRVVAFAAEGDGLGEWDAARMSQVVANLIGNALKYSPPTTPVSASLREREDRIELAVHNEGAPIPEEEQPDIFAPFRRGKGKRSGADGIGLGLFIAHEMVRAHGGDIALRSEPGAGTTFTISVPRTQGRSLQ